MFNKKKPDTQGNPAKSSFGSPAQGGFTGGLNIPKANIDFGFNAPSPGYMPNMSVQSHEAFPEAVAEVLPPQNWDTPAWTPPQTEASAPAFPVDTSFGAPTAYGDPFDNIGSQAAFDTPTELYASPQLAPAPSEDYNPGDNWDLTLPDTETDAFSDGGKDDWEVGWDGSESNLAENSGLDSFSDTPGAVIPESFNPSSEWLATEEPATPSADADSMWDRPALAWDAPPSNDPFLSETPQASQALPFDDWMNTTPAETNIPTYGLSSNLSNVSTEDLINNWDETTTTSAAPAYGLAADAAQMPAQDLTAEWGVPESSDTGFAFAQEGGEVSPIEMTSDPLDFSTPMTESAAYAPAWEQPTITESTPIGQWETPVTPASDWTVPETSNSDFNWEAPTTPVTGESSEWLPSWSHNPEVSADVDVSFDEPETPVTQPYQQQPAYDLSQGFVQEQGPEPILSPIYQQEDPLLGNWQSDAQTPQQAFSADQGSDYWQQVAQSNTAYSDWENQPVAGHQVITGQSASGQFLDTVHDAIYPENTFETVETGFDEAASMLFPETSNTSPVSFSPQSAYAPETNWQGNSWETPDANTPAPPSPDLAPFYQDEAGIWHDPGMPVQADVSFEDNSEITAAYTTTENAANWVPQVPVEFTQAAQEPSYPQQTNASTLSMWENDSTSSLISSFEAEEMAFAPQAPAQQNTSADDDWDFGDDSFFDDEETAPAIPVQPAVPQYAVPPMPDLPTPTLSNDNWEVMPSDTEDPFNFDTDWSDAELADTSFAQAEPAAYQSGNLNETELFQAAADVNLSEPVAPRQFIEESYSADFDWSPAAINNLSSNTPVASEQISQWNFDAEPVSSFGIPENSTLFYEPQNNLVGVPSEVPALQLDPYPETEQIAAYALPEAQETIIAPAPKAPANDGIHILHSLELTPFHRLLLVQHQQHFALMGQVGPEEDANIAVVKLFGENPLSHSPEFLAVKEGQSAHKEMFVVKLGSWQGVIAVDNDRIQLHTEF